MLDKFKSINTFILDMDGVLTDGLLTLMPGGVMARRMNVKDGYAMQLAVKKGYKLVVISGSSSDEAVDRLSKLGIDNVWMKALNKMQTAETFMQQHRLDWSSVLVMGDDIPDLEILKNARLPCCPADAVQEVKDVVVYISPLKGGGGCVRDVIEKVMKLRGDWNEDIYTPSA